MTKTGVNGSQTSRMVKAMTSSIMVIPIKVNTNKGNRMGKGLTHGQMGVPIPATSLQVSRVVKEFGRRPLNKREGSQMNKRKLHLG